MFPVLHGLITAAPALTINGASEDSASWKGYHGEECRCHRNSMSYLWSMRGRGGTRGFVRPDGMIKTMDVFDGSGSVHVWFGFGHVCLTSTYICCFFLFLCFTCVRCADWFCIYFNWLSDRRPYAVLYAIFSSLVVSRLAVFYFLSVRTRGSSFLNSSASAIT